MFLNLSCKIAVCTINERKFGFLTYGAKRNFALERHKDANGCGAHKAHKQPCDEVSYAEEKHYIGKETFA